MMKQPPRQKTIKDERDEQIDTQAKVHSLELQLSVDIWLVDRN